ncbi:MAG: hypothetical protein HZC48_09025 [Nitrospirae bacterium]|nr:hypothetical protein [Nitrospirota bacterium]
MDSKKYSLITSLLFAVIATLHLLRLLLSWEAVIGGWRVPEWFSVAAFAVAGFLSYNGFRLGIRK